VLGWPADGVVRIKSLGISKNLMSDITSIELLGYRGSIEWARRVESLEVKMPNRKPCDHAFVLVIR